MFIRGIYLREGAAFDGPNAYLQNLPVLKNLPLDLDAPVCCFTGENGSGKSTLLEAIAVGFGFNAEGGSRNFRFSTRDSHSALYEQLVLVKGVKRPKDGFFLRAESFYNVASEIDRINEDDATMLEDYGGVSLHEQSHGESFWSLLNNRFGAGGLYLLDEPEAALSPQRQMAVLVLLNRLARAGSQFILATHSPILLAYPGAKIYELGAQGARKRRWEELENVQLYRDFLRDPQRMLYHLGLDGDDRPSV